MRISDWSSDVCSSDLCHRRVRYRQDRTDQLPAEPGAEAPAVADDFLLRQGPGRGDLRPGVRRQLPGAGERPVDRVQSVPVRSRRGKRAVPRRPGQDPGRADHLHGARRGRPLPAGRKTALINFLLSQVQKLQPSPTIFFFDKDRGAEIFVRACGGNYLALENGRSTGFNPFQCDRDEANVQFLADLVKVLAAKTTYTARDEEDIYRAVESMLDTPMHLRSMTNFQKSLPNMGDDGLFARMRKWTAGNSLGWVFDNPVDTIDLQKASIIGFDYTDIIDNPEVRVPVINYLLHRLEELIDGRPLIYVMDEFWKILDGSGGLKEFAKNKQKTIRKQNGLGIFATQSPEDALQSDISAALIEQTATLVLLPNPNASREDYVEGLKLTDAEYQVVKSLDERSRCFLVKQGHASSVCTLNLRGMDEEIGRRSCRESVCQYVELSVVDVN